MTLDRYLAVARPLGAAIVVAFSLSVAPALGQAPPADPTVLTPPVGTLPAPPTPPVATAPATQNTVTTTGPVNSTTSISVGTLAGQVLTWIAAVFSVPVGTLITAWLYRLFAKAGIDITDAMRARLQEMIVNGLNVGAKTAAADLRNKGNVEIKNATIRSTVAYVQEHGAAELKAIGVDPNSNIAVDAIKARIETAINDVNQPTPKVLTELPVTPVAPTNSDKVTTAAPSKT
jgi:hypothetical protein